MELTLFGVIESKTEAKKRAERISLLVSRIADGPDDRKCIRSQYNQITHFVTKAKAKKMDPNEHDGLQRTIGDLSGLLTEKECAEMRDNPRIWKAYTGDFAGWCGSTPRDRYCTTLHKKEIAYLEECRAEVVSNMLNLREALSSYRRELAELRALADLPEEIAKRYQLTPKGERLKK
jgi:hypothetical protein